LITPTDRWLKRVHSCNSSRSARVTGSESRTATRRRSWDCNVDAFAANINAGEITRWPRQPHLRRPHANDLHKINRTKTARPAIMVVASLGSGTELGNGVGWGAGFRHSNEMKVRFSELEKRAARAVARDPRRTIPVGRTQSPTLRLGRWIAAFCTNGAAIALEPMGRDLLTKDAVPLKRPFRWLRHEARLRWSLKTLKRLTFGRSYYRMRLEIRASNRSAARPVNHRPAVRQRPSNSQHQRLPW
jgi:hypothetical protein